MSTQIRVKRKISRCPGFSKEYYTCPKNGQFGLHDGHGGHICDYCDHCLSVNHYRDRVEISCLYPHTKEDVKV